MTRVIDGDTVDVDLFLGFGVVWHDQRIRLWGVDTPEVRGKERPRGLAVKEFVRGAVEGRDVMVRTFLDGRGKFGRLLGILYVPSDDGTHLNLNRYLAENDMAVLATFKREPFPGWPDLGIT